MHAPKMSQENIVPEECSVALWARKVVTLVSRTMRGEMAGEMTWSGKHQAALRAFVRPVHLQDSTS